MQTMHNLKIKKQKTCIIMQSKYMQRVFAAIYAIYEKLVLKHCYNKQTMLQRD